MASDRLTTPTPPPGFTMDAPTPPPGFTMDAPTPPPGFTMDAPTPPPGFTMDTPQEEKPSTTEPQTNMQQAPSVEHLGEKKWWHGLGTPDALSFAPDFGGTTEQYKSVGKIGAAVATAPATALASGYKGLAGLPTLAIKGGAGDILKDMQHVGGYPAEVLGLSEDEMKAVETVFVPFEKLHSVMQFAGDKVAGWATMGENLRRDSAKAMADHLEKGGANPQLVKYYRDSAASESTVAPEIGAAIASAGEAGVLLLAPKAIKGKISDISAGVKSVAELSKAGRPLKGFDKPAVEKVPMAEGGVRRATLEPATVESVDVLLEGLEEATPLERANAQLKEAVAPDPWPLRQYEAQQTKSVRPFTPEQLGIAQIPKTAYEFPVHTKLGVENVPGNVMKGQVLSTGEPGKVVTPPQRSGVTPASFIESLKKDFDISNEVSKFTDSLRERDSKPTYAEQRLLAEKESAISRRAETKADLGALKAEEPRLGQLAKEEARIAKQSEGRIGRPLDTPDTTYAKSERPLAVEQLLKERPGERGSFSTRKMTDAEYEAKIARYKEVGETVKDVFGELAGTVTGTGMSKELRRLTEGVQEGWLSPEVVFARDPKIGKPLFRVYNQADVGKNAFRAKHGTALKAAAGKGRNNIKAGTPESRRVGEALDGQRSPDTLKPQEKALYRHLKKEFKGLLHTYVRSKVGSTEAFNKLVKAASKEHHPVSKVSELGIQGQELYARMHKGLGVLRKGRKVSDLPATELKRYKAIRSEMQNVLKKGWVEKLTPGEAEAFDLLKREIADYLPHIFPKDVLLTEFVREIATIRKKLETAVDPGAITGYRKRLDKLNNAVVKMQGGELVLGNELPQNVNFRFFKQRRGNTGGYSLDAMQSYTTYLNGIATKLFDEPAIRKAAELHKDLDPSLKSFHKKFGRRFMGWDRSKFDGAAGAIASFEWMRTLGGNPRSAIVNLTQRVNTIAEVGAKHSAIGQKKAFTKEGKALFRETGIAQEIPSVLMEGNVPVSLETARAILGYAFNKVEYSNRQHAFLSGYSKAKAKTRGISEADAVQAGVETVHKTQFQYGRMGMPMVMSHPAGRLAFQFWSYPVKQMELMVNWAKNDPKKLVSYLAMSEGGNYLLGEFLDTDLSNALGIGVNWGEALGILKGLTEGDVEKIAMSTRLTFGGGGGLFPSGFGPSVTDAAKIVEGFSKGEAYKEFKKAVTPVQAKRIVQGYQSLVGKNIQGMYPVYDQNGRVMYYLDGSQLARRTFGPRPAKESREYARWAKNKELDDLRTRVIREQTDSYLEGDTKTFNRLVERYGIIPSMDQIANAQFRKVLTREQYNRVKQTGLSQEELFRRRHGGTL